MTHSPTVSPSVEFSGVPVPLLPKTVLLPDMIIWGFTDYFPEAEGKGQTSPWAKLNSSLSGMPYILGCSPKVSPNPSFPNERSRTSSAASTAWDKAKGKLFGRFSQDGYVCQEQNPFTSISSKCVCVQWNWIPLEYGNHLLTSSLYFLPLYDTILFSNNRLMI